LSLSFDNLDAVNKIFQKRKHNIYTVSDADTSESILYPIRTLLSAVPAQTDGVAQKKRRLDDIMDLINLLQSMVHTRYINS
jgi:hypothetical protein